MHADTEAATAAKTRFYPYLYSQTSTYLWSIEEALGYLADHIEIDDHTGCHLWTGALNRDGYGQITIDSLYQTYRLKGVHRLMYALTTRRIPRNRHVQIMHSCDVRRCCNPAHLELGSASANSADKVAKQRQARGTMQGRSKVTDGDVRIMRDRRAAGELLKDIARDYPLSKQVISTICRRESWKHVA